MKRTLPKSRDELRQRCYRQTNLCHSERPLRIACEDERACRVVQEPDRSVCAQSCPQPCDADYVDVRPYTQRVPCEQMYYKHPCIHYPYTCMTHRHRAHWCSYCTSSFLFPEYRLACPTYVVQQTCLPPRCENPCL